MQEHVILLLRSTHTHIHFYLFTNGLLGVSQNIKYQISIFPFKNPKTICNCINKRRTFFIHIYSTHTHKAFWVGFFFFYICWFLWILSGRSALIEFGHRSRVNVSVLRIMSEPYGTNRERLKARAGCEMANRCFRRGRFPTHPSDDWARCWQFHISIWEQINVKLYDTYIRALGVCGDVQTDRRGQRETARNRETTANTKQHLMSGYRPDLLAPPPHPHFLTGLNSNGFIPTLQAESTSPPLHQRKSI